MKKMTLCLFLLAISMTLAAPLKAEEVKTKHAGLTLNAEWITAGDEWKSKPVVLMTHGTLMHGRMEIMEAMQTLFADAGYSSLSLTLSLGLDDRHGPYECAATHKHKHTDALDEIGVWLTWLKKQGVEQVVLLGHSRGGNQTAWFSTERHDAAIKKVILVAPATWSEVYAVKDYQERFGMDVAGPLAASKKLVAAGKGKQVINPVSIIYCKDSSATAESFVAYHGVEPRMHTPSLLGKIQVPVMVFAGSEDTVVKNIEQYVQPMANDKIKLSILEGADHMFRDLYAEDLVDEAVAFIEE
ncbi:hypothetical protein BOW53_16395 [Solemya pervernicosa gill symbiont]|uniref:Serine aminopeptidase S33 domain-containing protein n=1 Tax=Solemya pervernicosa gill symbiont TaxID=642797 RepID=A0A1T2KZA8_9GAMM|nr:alpha/beta hydrolase [Solemya pervernicosa gill symbiont]OOZ38172.1 hypothetical protein BOW53_16395 [Solemya pervernicosa gill symbiont]